MRDPSTSLKCTRSWSQELSAAVQSMSWRITANIVSENPEGSFSHGTGVKERWQERGRVFPQDCGKISKRLVSRCCYIKDGDEGKDGFAL